MYSKPSNSVWSMASSVVLRERGREGGREGGGREGGDDKWRTENKAMTYGSSGVNSVGSTTNWGSKFEGSRSESILGL